MTILSWLRWKRLGLDTGARTVWESYGFSVEHAAQWIAAGVKNAGRAKAWQRHGFPSPGAATAWLAAAVSPEEAAEWAAVKFSPADRHRWLLAGVASPTDALLLATSGADLSDLFLWRELGFDVRAITEWSAARFRPPEAASWADFGLAPAAARAWSDARFTPEDAEAWAREGFEASNASTWVEGGFEPSDARLWARGFNHGPTADGWRRRGFSPSDAERWARRFADPALAEQWREVFPNLIEASEWAAVFDDPDRAAELVAADVRPQQAMQARSLIAGLPHLPALRLVDWLRLPPDEARQLVGRFADPRDALEWWVSLGRDSRRVGRLWSLSNGDLEEAELWARVPEPEGVAPLEVWRSAGLGPRVASVVIHMGASQPADVSALIADSGVNLDEFAELAEAGAASLRSMQAWLALGPGVLGWLRAGFRDPSTARLWIDERFQPASAEAWVDAGLNNPAEASRLESVGVGPDELAGWARLGVRGAGAVVSERARWSLLAASEFVELVGGDLTQARRFHEAVRVVEVARAWLAVCDEVAVILNWTDANFTLEEAGEWITLGESSVELVGPWLERGEDAGSYARFREATGGSLQDAVTWREELGQAVWLWLEQGARSLPVAAAWRGHGSRPADVGHWLVHGVGPDDAAAWDASGLSAAAVVAWLALGIRDPEFVSVLLDLGVDPDEVGTLGEQGSAEFRDRLAERLGLTAAAGRLLVEADDTAPAASLEAVRRAVRLADLTGDPAVEVRHGSPRLDLAAIRAVPEARYVRGAVKAALWLAVERDPEALGGPARLSDDGASTVIDLRPAA